MVRARLCLPGHLNLSWNWNARGNREEDDGHSLFRSGRRLSLKSLLVVAIQAFFVGLLDQWPSLFDTAPYQFRFNLGFLAGEQIHFGLKRSIPWQLNLDSVFSWADKHGMKSSSQFPSMSQERIIYKHRRPRGLYVDLQSCGHGRRDRSGFFLHFDVNQLGLPGLHDDSLRGINIASLANGNLVFARQQHDLFRALKFLQISDVLAVNPDARSLFHFRRPVEIHLSHDLILPEQRTNGQCQRTRGGNPSIPASPLCDHACNSFHLITLSAALFFGPFILLVKSTLASKT